MTEDIPATSSSSPITDHFDRYLGEIKDGWRPNQGADGLAIAQFSLSPAPGWTIMGTYGLSRDILAQEEGQNLRQELLLCWPEEEIADSTLSHLNAVGQMVMQTGEALARGALLAIPAEPLLPSWGKEPWAAWYITMPFFLPESGILLNTINPPLLFTWMMPVYAEEADFVVSEGPEEFDKLILANREACFERPRKSLLPRT